jgi:hypothetical protein
VTSLVPTNRAHVQRPLLVALAPVIAIIMVAIGLSLTQLITGGTDSTWSVLVNVGLLVAGAVAVLISVPSAVIARRMYRRVHLSPVAPHGLDGWLAVFVVSLVVVLVMTTAGLVGSATAYSAYHALGWDAFWAFDVISGLLDLLLGALLVIAIVKRHVRTRRLALLWLGILGGSALIEFIWAPYVFGVSSAGIVTGGTIRSIIYALIGLAYFTSSRRVHLTFAGRENKSLAPATHRAVGISRSVMDESLRQLLMTHNGLRRAIACRDQSDIDFLIARIEALAQGKLNARESVQGTDEKIAWTCTRFITSSTGRSFEVFFTRSEVKVKPAR